MLDVHNAADVTLIVW